MNESEKIGMDKRKKWIILITSIIIVFVLIAFGWYLFQPKQSIDLFTTHFEPYEDVIEDYNMKESDLLTIAMAAYREEQYAVAMKTLNRFLNEVDSITPENRTASEFYLAISNLGTGNTNTAIGQFQQIADNADNRFQEQADWYIVLANIKKHKIEKARILLTKIQSNPKHGYYEEAKILLKALL